MLQRVNPTIVPISIPARSICKQHFNYSIHRLNILNTFSNAGKTSALPTGDSLFLASGVVFTTWLETVDILQVFARLPAWLLQPISALAAWPAFPSLCVTPNIVEEHPRVFSSKFKQVPEFFNVCLFL